MTKPRKLAEIQADADRLLAEISAHRAFIAETEEKATEELQRIHEHYAVQMSPHKDLLTACEKELLRIMKGQRRILFDGTDLVTLPHGSLIHNVADRISIPRGALDACESLGFNEVIKIAKSLDRDAIEQWPDAKLLLIGAERKPKEEFSYDLKREGTTA